MKHIIKTRAIFIFVFVLALTSLSSAAHAGRSFDIVLVTWRGCEDACDGVKSYFRDNGLPVEVQVIDANRDKARLRTIADEIKEIKPDLVITWGTSVSVGLIGSIDDYGETTKLDSIPALFMIVSDSIASGLVKSFKASGRTNLTGVRNRLSDDTFLRYISEYIDFKKLGVFYSDSEINSVNNIENLKALSQSEGFEFFYEYSKKETPTNQDIRLFLEKAKRHGVDAIYIGSSSMNRVIGDAYTKMALEVGIPVFSSYQDMVENAKALMSVSSDYRSVGRLAAEQAWKILYEGAQPGHMEIKALSRFSLTININTARQLALIPPMSLMNIADIVR